MSGREELVTAYLRLHPETAARDSFLRDFYTAQRAYLERASVGDRPNGRETVG